MNPLACMTSILICVYGNPVLRKKALPITTFDTALKQEVESMFPIMYTANGIGLAAPQVGKSKQLIVIDLQSLVSKEFVTLDNKEIPEALTQPLVLANPSYIPVGVETVLGIEGCLSLPGLSGNVARYKEIIASYQDVEGVRHTLRCKDLLARCIQHEIDHLNGILYIDRMSKTDRAQLKDGLMAIKAHQGWFEYVTEKSTKIEDLEAEIPNDSNDSLLEKNETQATAENAPKPTQHS